MTKTYIFALDQLEDRHIGLTKSIANTFTEAACVCLDRHHTSPVVFSVESGEKSGEGVTAWMQTDERTKGAWANETDTTEAGAYCVALVAVEAANGLVAVRRAETHTGADFYLGMPGQDLEDLEKSHRLEVSGVDKGNMSSVRARLKAKVKQTTEGNSNLPAIAAVVGFAVAAVLMEDVDPQ